MNVGHLPVTVVVCVDRAYCSYKRSDFPNFQPSRFLLGAFFQPLCLRFGFFFIALSCVSSAAANPTETSSQRYERGKQLLNQGRYEEASELFRTVAEQPSGQALKPQSAPASKVPSASVGPLDFARQKLAQWHVDAGKAAFESKESLAAIAHAQRALELDNMRRDAKQLLSKAQRAYQQERQRISRKEALIAKAQEAGRQANSQRALFFWRQANSLDPQDPVVRQGLQQAEEQRKKVSPPIQHSADLTRLADSLNPASLTEPYLISIGDVLEVFVWQQPDLSRDVVVRPDGRISFPLVGDVDALGMSLTQLDNILTEKLKTYVRYPDVSLAIKRFGGTKTIVLGEVGRPGIYVPPGEGRVLDVIAMAGGFSSGADTKDVMLIRGGLASPQLAALDINSALTRGNLQENVRLEPNDILYVAKQGRSAWGNVKAILDDLAPLLNETLVFQSVATNFGAREFQRTGRSTGVE